MILAPTWKAYFASRESNARGNKSPAAYLTAWSNTATPESKLNLLTNDPDTAILAGDSGQGIMVLHSFKNLGGTILSPSNKVACLLGGTRMAPILVINEVTTFDDIEIVTPSANDIFMICESEPLMTAGHNQRKLTLHLKDTTGKTSEDIASGSKLTVKAPTTFQEMFQQLKFFRGA